MKMPRVADFDPNAKPIPPLVSSMDNFPSIQKPILIEKPTPPVLGVPRTTVPPGRRKIKQRHPFDIYQDQLDTLRQIAYEDRMNGEVGSMSAMVRDAIDMYLKIKKKRNH